MTVFIFHSAFLLLLGSCLAGFWIRNRERLVTLSLVQALIALPLLAGLYIYFTGQWDPIPMVPLLLFGESVFGVVWLGLAFRLGGISEESETEPLVFSLAQCVLGGVFAGLLVYSRGWGVAVDWSEIGLVIAHYGQVYFYAIFLLLMVLFAAWRLEVFWSALEPARRWAYKFLVVGGFVVCGALGWAASYRLTYGLLVREHFLLLSGLLFVAWIFMGSATARHKLHNRKIFISRKVVYTFVSPMVFAVYLLALGVVSLLMKTYGLAMPFVLNGLAVAFGAIGVGLFLFSGTLRRRVKFFISTHFYVNKYEYRDEWLALSARLKGALTEADVVEALQQVMAGSLYTSRMVIWSGDSERGYRVISAKPVKIAAEESRRYDLFQDDPLVRYMANYSCLNLQGNHPEKALESAGNQACNTAGVDQYQAVVDARADFFNDLGIVLMVSLSIGDQMVGMIGLGPEFTGASYGHDDYDLLAALGSQAAAALMAVRMTEKLAEARERRAWDRLSAFVLHDIKNAAAMLSLVRTNAPAHIHKPEFQADLLELVDDALARMGKVQQRLGMLKADILPVLSEMSLQRFLKESCGRIGRTLKSMTIALNCPADIRIKSDPEMLFRILENLILNAFEAAGESAAVQIDVLPCDNQRQVSIAVTDNGPGIDEDLLPDVLFEPLKTTREKGSGIGLWQARQLAVSLNGVLQAENMEGSGARLEIRLPV